MKKPCFSTIPYRRDECCHGWGNHAVTLPVLASWRLREKTEEEIAAEKADYEEAKEMYDKYINRGVMFKGKGEKASKDLILEIVSISWKKSVVRFKQPQFNVDYYNEKHGWKVNPSVGSFTINGFINLLKNGHIEIVEAEANAN